MNIKCMFGVHDWEECRVSEKIGWVQSFPENIPFVRKIRFYRSPLRFYPASDYACLRCGKINRGIEDCKEQIRKYNWKKLRERRVAKQRALAAKEICSMNSYHTSKGV